MKLLLFVFLVSCGLVRAVVVEESVVHAGVKFRVVKLDPARVAVVWKDGQGVPYRSFDKVQAAFAKQGKKVGFLMNAGIYEPGGIPSGLHIENKKSLRPINLADAPGNFFLKPNGVCAFGTGEISGPFIGPCAAWQKRGGQESWAIQSGPLLLIDGKRHPAFTENSKSKLLRNGVGVDDKKQLVFAITAKGEMVNFWDFAGLFLKLGCKDALFLDGDISQMVVNPDKPVASNRFGAMFVVAE
ncbi:MAG: phosphodiester glycosidase family protein [Verrucomicrobiota bacterium]